MKGTNTKIIFSFLIERNITTYNFYNICILSDIILASHSGNGTHAYFKNLYQMKENELIFFYYQDKKQEYRFFKKEEVEKTSAI